MNSEVKVLTNDDVKSFYKVKRIIYLGSKRIFDILISIIGLIILLPASIFVKVSYMLSGDFTSIFFIQDRIGKDGKLFKFYKFRSMVPNADEILLKTLANNEELAEEYRINKKLKDDPRITKTGKIIRKLSIDELPQFINVTS